MILDYDNDGLPDILFLNGGQIKDGNKGPGPVLYRNLGGLKFQDVTKVSGLTDRGWEQGGCAGDIDNDGHIDLFISAWGHNVLYRNQGAARFETRPKTVGSSPIKLGGALVAHSSISTEMVT